ncbi:MAG TPA: hypothetical protein VFR67_20805 [Pilimelia sp.]|nr:hypothetical protein [Pilimelia sp.]
MTPELTAAACRRSVLELGGAFLESPWSRDRARQLGLSGLAFHIAGRGGALGDVRADTVAAALGFIAPEAVNDGWDAARRITSPADVAAQNLAECCRWGAGHLDAFGGVERLVELTERLVLAADPAGMPLFAAWRAMPVPAGGPGSHAAILLHLLSEHRCGAHLLAVRAAGLTPLAAIIAGPDGEAGAVKFGWRPPYPPVGPLVRRRAWAEAVTDRIAGQAYEVLEVAERADLVRLLDGASAAARALPVTE